NSRANTRPKPLDPPVIITTLFRGDMYREVRSTSRQSPAAATAPPRTVKAVLFDCVMFMYLPPSYLRVLYGQFHAVNRTSITAILSRRYLSQSAYLRMFFPYSKTLRAGRTPVSRSSKQTFQI